MTSGGLGPTADDLTAEVVARFAGRELVLDQGMEEKIARILARFARRLRFDPEALREANRKQAMVPRGAATIDPAGTAPGLVVPTEGPTVIVLPGPPRELQEMWPRALETEPARAVLDRATPFRGYTLRLLGMPESEIAKTLREVEGDIDLSALEITTCLRRRRAGGGRPPPRSGRTGGGCPAPGDRRPPRPLLVQRGREHDRRAGRAAVARPPGGPRRVVQRRPAGGAAHQGAGRLRVRGRWRRRLLERGEGKAAGRRAGG